MTVSVPRELRETLFGGEQPDSDELAHLSDLPAAIALEGRPAWNEAPLGRRLALLRRLRKLADENVEYNFRTVYMLALGDDEPAVRTAAVECLWEEEGLALLGRLRELVLADASPEVRAAAAEALARYAYKATVGELPDAEAGRLRVALHRALRDAPDGTDLQLRTVEALAYFGDDPLLGDQIRRMYREGDEDERASAVAAMGHSMEPRWQTAVLRAIEDESLYVRSNAARAAGEMGLPDAVADVLRLLDDTEPEVRDAAVWCLGQIGTPPATEALRRLSDDGPHELRVAAEEALGEAMYADSAE